VNPETSSWFVTDTLTGENVVTPLIDGQVALSTIQTYISALGDGDFCFYGSWIMFHDSTTLPGSSKTLGEEFVDAINRGADIRILLYKGMPGSSSNYNSDHRQTHLRVKNDIGAAGGQVIIDTLHPNVGSHHDKYAIFGRVRGDGTYELTGFCGGIDPVYDRIDDPLHSATGILGSYHGWHDVHTQIQGPAATYLWYDFVNRWNSHDDAPAYWKTATTRIASELYGIIVPPLTGPKHQVEVLNTYSCGSYPSWFVPSSGVRTIHQAYLNAIANAQHYIYIESPFFVDEDISTALRDRLNQNPPVYVIVLTNLYGEGEGYYLNANFDIIREAPAALPCFYPCQLIHEDGGIPVYVHSKLMIVDDVYYTLGSANVTPRSMTMDTEINIGVVGDDVIVYSHQGTDYEVRETVRDLRAVLWAEHLRSANPEPLFQIPTAIETWIASIGVAPSRVHVCDPSSSRTSNPLKIISYSTWHNTIAHPTKYCF
jgi:phosphatidylserine/phosphatidylglycerophosphate/cardiolipin synthase-like enzyme